MGKNKDGKKHKKGSQFAIRVDKAERDAFVTLCEALDTTAAREIRRFMREWVAANSPGSAAEAAAPETPDDPGRPDGSDPEAPQAGEDTATGASPEQAGPEDTSAEPAQKGNKAKRKHKHADR